MLYSSSFSGGVGNFSGGVEIFLGGGVEKFLRGIEVFSEGLGLFRGEGVEKFRGVEKLLREIEKVWGGGVKNILGIEIFERGS